MKENDTFVLSKPTVGTVIGERRDMVLPAGTQVAVVMVFGDSDRPSAYEIEAFILQDQVYVLATIDARDV